MFIKITDIHLCLCLLHFREFIRLINVHFAVEVMRKTTNSGGCERETKDDGDKKICLQFQPIFCYIITYTLRRQVSLIDSPKSLNCSWFAWKWNMCHISLTIWLVARFISKSDLEIGVEKSHHFFLVCGNEFVFQFWWILASTEFLVTLELFSKNKR